MSIAKKKSGKIPEKYPGNISGFRCCGTDWEPGSATGRMVLPDPQPELKGSCLV
jgi:hypothetical protein